MKEKCKKQVNRYLMNLMDEKEEIDFQRHLLECSDCREYLDKLRKIQNALMQNDDNVIKLETKRSYFKYYAMVASVCLLIVGGLIVYVIRDNDIQDQSALLISQLEKKREKIEPQFRPINRTQDTLPSIKVQKDKSSVEDKDEDEVVDNSCEVVGIKNPPAVARAVVVTGGASSEESKSYVLPDAELEFGTVITPSVLDLKYDMTNDSIFEFKLNTYYDTPFFIYIKADGGTLDNFHEEGNSFQLDLRNYKNNSVLEWSIKVIGEAGAIRNKGLIRLKETSESIPQ